jgi:hypothetical protein
MEKIKLIENIRKFIKEKFMNVINEESHNVYVKFDDEEIKEDVISFLDIKPTEIRGHNVVYKVGTEEEGEQLKSKIKDLGGKAIVGAENTEKYKKIVQQQIANRNKAFQN